MKRVSVALLLIWLAAPVLSAEPQWLTDARAKEGKLTEPHLVTSADKALSFSIPVPLSEGMTADKDSYSALLRLGPDVVASCEMLNNDIDVAALLRETAKNTFSAISAGKQGKIEKTAVEHIDVGVAEDTPYLSISWLYRVNDGKTGPRLGALRQIAASRAGHGIYCAMDDLGYAHTFETAVRGLIATLKRKDDEAAPYYREVSLASLGGTRIGFSTVDLWRDKDGDSKCMDTTALLFARTPEAVQAHDSTDIQFITPDGGLINAKRVSATDGDIEMNLDLVKAADSNWTVRGKFRGKDVSETVGGGNPSTFISETALRRTLLAKKDPIGAEATEEGWGPADPVHFGKSSVKVLTALGANSYRLRETKDDLSAELTVEGATGLITQAIVQMGPGTISAERVYVQGKL